MKNTAYTPKTGNGLVLLIGVGNYIQLKWIYHMPSVLFVGYRQTVQTQIRHNALSYQGLHCLLTES